MKKIIQLISVAFISHAALAQSEVSIIAGNPTAVTTGDGGPATSASVGGTQGICKDAAGNIYIYDGLHYSIRKINTSGIITTVAGAGVPGYSGDGGPATDARISAYGVNCDAAGNLFIGDWWNHRVRKVDATTGIITTIAGSGTRGATGDGGPATAAQLNAPIDAYADLAHNVYITEYSGNRIRRVDALTGIITTIGGNGTRGHSGDGGPATAATLNSPVQITTDRSNNIYIAEQSGYVRKISATGLISTVAGGGSSRLSGVPATTARLNGPEGVAVDCAGNIFISDNNNQIIRCVDASGMITTVAGGGTGTVTYAGVPALSGSFHNQLICLDRDGNMFCTDDEAPYVYKFSNASTPSSGGSITVPGMQVCLGQTGSLGLPGDGAWTSSAPGIATIHPTTGVVTGMALGVALITFTPIACGSIVSTVTVTAAPPAITGDSVLCSGSRILLSNSMTGGTWMSSNITVAAMGTLPGSVTGLSAGTAVISYLFGSGCFTSLQVTVNPIPAPITGITNICEGAVTTLTNSVSGGYWTGGLGIVTIGFSTGIVTGIASGLTTIAYTLPTGCRTTLPVTVIPSPSIYPLTGEGSYCALSAGSHVGLAHSEHGVIYQLFYGASPSGSPLAGTGAPLSFGTHSLPGTYKIVATSIAAACTSNMADSIIVSIRPVDTVSHSSDTSICVSSDWYPPVTLTIAGGSDQRWFDTIAGGSYTASLPGVYWATYTDSPGCHFYSDTILLIHNQAPPIFGNDVLCIGDTLTLSDIAPGGTWTSSIPSIASINTTGTVTGHNTGTTIITYLLPNGCLQTLPVNVLPPCTTAISGLNISNEAVVLQPNPATDELTIIFDNSRCHTLLITNNIEQVVMQQHICKAQTTLDVKKLPTGVYYISFTSETGTTVKKFLKL